MVETPTSAAQVIRFGIFEVDLQAGELRRKGRKLKLQEQPFQVLALLLERPGEVVTREALREKLWPVDTFVEFDHSLNTAISKIREALGDLADNPRFVETLPRRGYRFIAPVEESGQASEPEATMSVPPLPWWRTTNRLLWSAVLLAVVIGGAVWFQFLRPSSKSEMAPMRIVPLTSLLGNEMDPALSPDGNQVAFSWDGETGDNFDIYVKLIGAETTLRLTDDPAMDCCPAWSPDGRYIAFTRVTEAEWVILTVPALGGHERKLTTRTVSYGTVIGSGSRRSLFVSWAPNGKFLAFSDKRSEDDPRPALFLLSLDTLEKRKLTTPPLQYIGDVAPAFSPDGKTLAFVRGAWSSQQDIYLLPVSGGEPRRLTYDNAWINGLDWTPDGREIVFSRREGSASLWKIPASGGEPKQVTLGEEDALFPSIAREGNRLVYQQTEYDTNIWRIEVPSSTSGNSSPSRLIASTQYEAAPHFSPDGEKITFCSNRSGEMEIWMSDSDGSNQVQLTALRNYACTPRWSPDGQQIAFDARPEGHMDILVLDVERRLTRRLTTDTANEVVPSWSHDGRWIYFASNRTGSMQIWKVPAEGGSAVQVTKHGGFVPLESPDGQFVYYNKDPAIWRVPVEGGEESLVLSPPEPVLWGYWAVTEEGIYFLNRTAQSSPAIQLFRFADRQFMNIAPLEQEPDPSQPGLAVSPDGRWILYLQMDQMQTDIMLVENFR